jgi:transposase-like protein
LETFVPPRCPNPACAQHRAPDGVFYWRNGCYRPRCRTEPVPRFRCRTCKRYFSRQTFRFDCRDRRPECNEPLLGLLHSGVGLRQAGRLLKLDVHSVQAKLRKMGWTCRRLHKNLCPKLTGERTFLLDEEETYEGASIRPLTMPVLIEKDHWFVVATTAGSIRRLAEAGTARRVRQDRDEQQRGIRRDNSWRCVKGVLGTLASRVGNEARITLRTDQKASYAVIATKVFGELVKHETTAGTDIRTTFNPLFPINATLAMTRDNLGRLRRRSWLVSKRAARLRAHLALFTIYRNYMRRRFNRDGPQQTPAVLLGLLPRQLHPHEVLAWRQDWGERSIHPMSTCASRTVREALAIPA